MSAIERENVSGPQPKINLRGRLLEFSRPYVMGILNLTPDSFHAASRVSDPKEAVRRVRGMIDDGADIIDIGGCSTRPGSESVGMEEEWQRLEEPLKAIREAFPEVIISIDTFHAEIARRCISEWSVDIVNDVSGGKDPKMFDTVAREGAGYVLMHTRGTPASMDSLCNYEEVVADVVRELAFRLDEAHAKGVCNVIVDPGFGFAKTTEQNLKLLKQLDYLKVLGCPILAGISRKRMVRESGECDAADSLISTVALNTVALMKGASIIRVHDVKEGVQTARTISRMLLN